MKPDDHGRDQADATKPTDSRRALSSRSITFALIAPPAVQAVRFLSKLLLPHFVTTVDFGEAMLAGLILFGVQYVAVFGLDEALVSAPRLDLALWRSMRRFQTLLATALAIVLIAIGFVLQLFPAQALLGELLIALAPMLVVANLATLPTALLVRDRAYARVFAVDLAAISAFTLVAVALAALGAGPWSLVGGWYANALVALVAATTFARGHMPVARVDSADFTRVRTIGGHFTGAAVLGYVGERLDSASIGFVLGRAILGLYELAQSLGGVLVNYASSLSERLLFPTLAAHHRESGLGVAYSQALRVTMLVLLPAHVLLVAASGPLVTTFFPPRWHGAAPLLALVAAAAAARCFDVVAVAALKAAGQGTSVFRLGLARLLLLIAALAISLAQGNPIVVAFAVLASRMLAAALALVLAATRLDLAAARGVVRVSSAGWVLGLWILAFAPAACYLDRVLDGRPVTLLVLQPLLALALWVLARVAIDHDEFVGEVRFVRARVVSIWRGDAG